MSNKKLTKTIKSKIKNLELDPKGRARLLVVGANAFSDGGKNYFVTTEFPENSGNYGYRGNIILDDEYVPLVEAAVRKIAEEFIDKKDVKAFIAKDGSLIYNPNKICFLDGNENTNKEDEVYAGFEDKWFIKTNRKQDLKAPKVYAAGAPKGSPALTDPDDDRVLADGSKANFAITLYPNTKYGTISASISIVKYRGDEFVAIGGGEGSLSEEDEDALFSDPEADNLEGMDDSEEIE